MKIIFESKEEKEQYLAASKEMSTAGRSATYNSMLEKGEVEGEEGGADTMKELVKKAKALKIKGFKEMSEAELTEAVKSAEEAQG